MHTRNIHSLESVCRCDLEKTRPQNILSTVLPSPLGEFNICLHFSLFLSLEHLIQEGRSQNCCQLPLRVYGNMRSAKTFEMFVNA